MSAGHIHPVFDRLVDRATREALLRQHSCALWFTGLSGSGKSTIAIALERKLVEMGYLAQVLDGDNIRSGINNNLGFSEADRVENIRRIAEVTRLFVQAGVITLNCFISPTRAMRNMAREIIGADDFMEIYINTPLAICEQRDVKGLYARARRGEIRDFTGIDAPYEAPESPALEIKTENRTVEECVDMIITHALPRIQLEA
ncbi:MAG: adenylyl-sulfate kinase [Saprospiraceae bacterium]|nr:adenylyl-sulfate kinase [Saprospiraceae bacterium]